MHKAAVLGHRYIEEPRVGRVTLVDRHFCLYAVFCTHIFVAYDFYMLTCVYHSAFKWRWCSTSAKATLVPSCEHLVRTS